MDDAYRDAYLQIMNTAQAKALRTQINHLAIELEAATTKAHARCIKQSIQAAEKQLTEQA